MDDDPQILSAPSNETYTTLAVKTYLLVLVNFYLIVCEFNNYIRGNYLVSRSVHESQTGGYSMYTQDNTCTCVPVYTGIVSKILL